MIDLLPLLALVLLVLCAMGYMRIYRPKASHEPPPMPSPTEPHAVYPTRSVEEALEVYSSPHLKALMGETLKGEPDSTYGQNALEATIEARNLGAILRALKR